MRNIENDMFRFKIQEIIMRQKIRIGMVGGGRDAFIGDVHRIAMRMDDRAELVCGAFSSTKQKSLESGSDLLIDQDRAYGTYREMFRKESKLPVDERMQVVVIVTPNNMHYPIAMAALDGGYHVICDKPMTTTLDEAINLEKKVKQNKRLFCLTHNYTGYPMVKEARNLIQSGKLGAIRRVVVEYPQSWLATRMETAGNKQAAWRTDPRRSGASGCMGDIGSHCHNLAEYITGLKVEEVCADLTIFIKGRPLDDDGSVLLKFNKNARGVIWASQIAVGEENGVNIRVYGEKGGIKWNQEAPNSLYVHYLNKPTEIHRTGNEYICEEAGKVTRLPSGHTEGFYEAFANIYNNFMNAVIDSVAGEIVNVDKYDFPTAKDGVRTAKFLNAVVSSSKSEDKWIPLEKKE